MPDTRLRARIGGPEDIAVVGPRCAGSTTLAMLLAEYHTAGGKVVEVRSAHHPRPGPVKCTVAHTDGKFYTMLAKDYPTAGLRPPEVVIHDGYIPQRPHRLITTSEIF